MDLIHGDEHELIFFCQGKRRYRTLKNKANPPKCRRQLFQKPDTSDEEDNKGGNSSNEEVKKPEVKDWVTCLKRCLDFDTTTSLNQFQSYLQFLNTYDAETASAKPADDKNQKKIVVDDETGMEFLLLDNMAHPPVTYDAFENKNVIIYYNNNSSFPQFIAPNIDMEHESGNYYSDVMLSGDDVSSDINDLPSLEVTNCSSGGLDHDEIMGCHLEVDHEEVIQSIQCISGSIDSVSCHSDDFSGSDEGFPEDFMDE